MYIECDHCSSGYELELPAAALAGGRSVKFRCTSCGHSFHVVRDGTAVASTPRPETEAPEPAPAPASPSPASASMQHVLLRQDGVSYHVPDVATLQRWIVERRVLPSDELDFGGGQWVQAGERPDLAPFFAIVSEVESATRKLAATAALAAAGPAPEDPTPDELAADDDGPDDLPPTEEASRSEVDDLFGPAGAASEEPSADPPEPEGSAVEAREPESSGRASAGPDAAGADPTNTADSGDGPSDPSGAVAPSASTDADEAGSAAAPAEDEVRWDAPSDDSAPSSLWDDPPPSDAAHDPPSGWVSPAPDPSGDPPAGVSLLPEEEVDEAASEWIAPPTEEADRAPEWAAPEADAGDLSNAEAPAPGASEPAAVSPPTDEVTGPDEDGGDDVEMDLSGPDDPSGADDPGAETGAGADAAPADAAPADHTVLWPEIDPPSAPLRSLSGGGETIPFPSPIDPPAREPTAGGNSWADELFLEAPPPGSSAADTADEDGDEDDDELGIDAPSDDDATPEVEEQSSAGIQPEEAGWFAEGGERVVHAEHVEPPEASGSTGKWLLLGIVVILLGGLAWLAQGGGFGPVQPPTTAGGRGGAPADTTGPAAAGGGAPATPPTAGPTAPPPEPAPSPASPSSAGAEPAGGATPTAEADPSAAAGSPPDAEATPAAPETPPAPPAAVTAGTFVRRGWRSLDRKRYADAEKHFMEALKLKAGLGEAEYGLGYVAQQRGDTATATRWLCAARTHAGSDVDLKREIEAGLTSLGARCP